VDSQSRQMMPYIRPAMPPVGRIIPEELRSVRRAAMKIKISVRIGDDARINFRYLRTQHLSVEINGTDNSHLILQNGLFYTFEPELWIGKLSRLLP
jgi:hypothetical protein